MTTHRRIVSPGRLAAPALILASFALAPARADAELIVNGGFESGLAGWTRAEQLGSEGTFFLQSGTASPVLGLPVPAPPGGLNAAMTDAEAGGSHVLYQDFIVPTGFTGGRLTFSLYIQNSAPEFFTPDSLDWATPTLNQQARVDILRAGSDPFSLAASDVLLNAFRTLAADPLESGYLSYSIDVSSLLIAQAGQTLRLRFAEVDNVGPFQFGVDDVSLVAAVPEPSSLALLAAGGLAAILACRRSGGRA